MSEVVKNHPSDKHYTAETNIRMLVALLKAHGIRKIIASPGTTNISFVASVQQDPYFEIYSAYDERSAAYMACGMAEESGEPVVLTCTGATASRNYVPGLTEAFYRKIPVLAVTATQHLGRVGRMHAQVLDRSQQMKDLVRCSIQLRAVHTEEDKKFCVMDINMALLELRRNGGGPVHINMETTYSNDFSVKALETIEPIRRYTLSDKLPEIKAKTIGIFVGAHSSFTQELIEAVERFCRLYNAAVIGDHTCGYRGRFFVQGSLLTCQPKIHFERRPEMIIHIGNISGAYMGVGSHTVWRVNPDGEISDQCGEAKAVFQMDEVSFFRRYVEMGEGRSENTAYLDKWTSELALLRRNAAGLELPFSNIWIARELAPHLPKGSVLHLGILNTLRSWNFFEVDPSIRGYSNTGGFGIDGCVSAMLGASLASPDKLFFGVFGDLAFFYDLNSLCNHECGRNLRILLINNGCGTEFKNYNHRATQFGDAGDPFMAARGHNGNQSHDLVRHYAEDLGFTYLSASNKEEFLANMGTFVDPALGEKSIVFEAFTDSRDESDALHTVSTIEHDSTAKVQNLAKNILGKKGVALVKKIL